MTLGEIMTAMEEAGVQLTDEVKLFTIDSGDNILLIQRNVRNKYVDSGVGYRNEAEVRVTSTRDSS